MTQCDPDDARLKLRSWLFPIAAVLAWFIVAANCADAESIEVPEMLLAGGSNVHSMSVMPSRMPKAAPMNMPGRAAGADVLASQLLSFNRASSGSHWVI